ncbi:uncharacterized protein BJX67DRAFT_368509 [Aspergillus lucknowensis]|uniref:Cytochrome P450 n=1 Tax=Aspergillus lucknowensis TaxID=176173 RepID=A0ABR4L620_9EURO
MSAYFQHSDARIFPQPTEFIPERGLEDVTEEMKNNYVPFSRGSRYCLGMNLSYCELSHVLAALFRPGGPDFDLYKTDESDVRPVHDFPFSLPKLESGGCEGDISLSRAVTKLLSLRY